MPTAASPVPATGGGRRLGQAEPNMAFHSVRTLSSSPGRTRFRRASKSRRRASSTSAGRRRGASERAPQDGPALEVAGVGHAVPVGRHRAELGAGGLDDLVRGPDVEAPLLALGVGVLGASTARPRGRPGRRST